MYPEFFDHIPDSLQSLFDGTNHPWEALDRLPALFQSVQRIVPPNLHPTIVIEGDVMIGEGTTIEPGVMIKGPTVIGRNCEIRSGAYIRGHVITGDRCVIGHTTELIRCVVMDDVRLDHFNYVSDSVLGNAVHFGAGAKIANLRFDQTEIIVHDIPTGRKKFGVVFGDHCQLGVNSMIGPGVCLEKNCWWASTKLLPSGQYTRESLKRHIGV